MLRQKGCSSVPTLFSNDSITKTHSSCIPAKADEVVHCLEQSDFPMNDLTSGRHQSIHPSFTFHQETSPGDDSGVRFQQPPDAVTRAPLPGYIYYLQLSLLLNP